MSKPATTTYIGGTFDVVFKLILRSFSALFPKWPVTRKQLAGKWIEIWDSERRVGVVVGYP